MAKDKKKPKKRAEGLWIRNEILNIRELNDSEKILLAHFDSFGEKGCYQSNKTLAEMFLSTLRTISKRIAKIKNAGFVYVKNPKGYYRTIWVKSNPEVKAAAKLWYRKGEIDKPKEGIQDGKKWPGKVEESGEPSRQECVFRHSKNLPTTNTDTGKETNRKTIAADLPLPAGGQASQLLEDRKAGAITKVEQLKKSFGSGGRRRTPVLTAAEREKRRQTQLRDLEAAEAVRKCAGGEKS